jgi:superfamily II DNA or RNA helicase
MSNKYSAVITKLNEVHIQVDCEPSLAAELYQHFSFRPDGYQFSPKYKARVWDGFIHIFNIRERRLYAGLFNQLVQFLKENNYTYCVNSTAYYGRIDEETHIDYNDFVKYIDTINLHSNGKKIIPRDFQYMAAFECIKYKRMVSISPTASGKSLIIYMIVRYLLDHDICSRFLLIFPSTGLIQQMANDFADYSSHNGFPVGDLLHMIYSGQDKKSKKPIHFSTWQSLYKLPASFYDGYDMVTVDEAHNAKSDSFVNIFENCRDIEYRYGFTGTLSNKNKVHRLVVQGLLGEAKQFTNTAELIERKEAANIDIHCVILDYSDETKFSTRKMKYPEEFEYICSHKRRNRFIKKLAIDLTGNTIILFQRKEQGKELFNMIKEEYDQVFYIDGDIKAEERERIRLYLDTVDDAIIIASYGTTSTGWSVKNLHNGIFASPYKSETKVLQSVGRGLRLHESKDKFKLFDIVDDLTWKNKQNYLLQHFTERVSYYAADSFNYKIIRVNIE